MSTQALVQKEYIQETVRETLLQLGFNLSSSDDIVEHQKDLHFLREKRKRSEAVKQHILMTAVGFMTVAILGMIGSAWLFLTNYRGE